MKKYTQIHKSIFKITNLKSILIHIKLIFDMIFMYGYAKGNILETFLG